VCIGNHGPTTHRVPKGSGDSRGSHHPVPLHADSSPHVPQVPPQPSSPHWRPAQVGAHEVMHLPATHAAGSPQAPHDPPQPSGPHDLPEHSGLHVTGGTVASGSSAPPHAQSATAAAHRAGASRGGDLGEARSTRH
jgi:hypothetical protein